MRLPLLIKINRAGHASHGSATRPALFLISSERKSLPYRFTVTAYWAIHNILFLKHTPASFRRLYHKLTVYGMVCLIPYWMIAAAKTGILLNGTKGVIRTWYNKKDIEYLADYNLLLKEVEMGAQGADKRLQLLTGSMSNTAQAAVKAANGGTVALKNLGYAFDWAALKAQALNAAVGMGIGLLISLAVSTLTTLIDNYIRRVEIAHEATAQTIAEYEKQESSIASLNDSLDENYGKLRELHALKDTDKWNDTLKEQYKTLQRHTLELEQQLELERSKATLTQKDVADKLKDEANKNENQGHVSRIRMDRVIMHTHGGAVNTRAALSESEYIDESIGIIENLNSVQSKTGRLTAIQVQQYQDIARELMKILTLRQEWIKQGEGNPWLTTEIDQWKELVRSIQGVLNPDIYNFVGLEDTTGYVSRSINSALRSGELSQAVYAQIQGADKTDFLNQTSKDSAAYAWVTEQAHAAQMSVEAYVDELVRLDIMTDNVVPKQDDLASSLLDIAKVANNDLEDAAKAYEALESAVSDYNDAGYITDDTLQAINDRLPGVLELLMDENGQLTDNAAAAMGSTDSLIKFIRAQLQAQLEAARTNYQNLVNELNRVKAAADGSAASMNAVIAAQTGLALAGKGVQDAQDALDNFNKYAESGAFTSKGRSGGGGGSKSIYSQQYEEITNLTEHYIKMSELRQKRMSKESDEYKAESKQQFLYYQQLAQQTYAEISRLRAKGYTEANADFRKLLQNYEGYLNSMYDIAKAMWEQEKQERIKAIQKQIDDENDRWESRKKQLDHEKDYYEALLDLEERYLDTIGDVHKEIRSLDKELAAAKAYPEGTNLSLFTDDEHDHLVAQLRDVEAEATDLYTKYQEKLASVSAENTYELSHITDEFQRQYEILLKQYEISKADLAVARARRELENVLNERNVAMLVNGVWTWVADPESVKAAVEAVYDAEQDAEDKLTDLFNTQRTQLLEETISNIELQTNIEQAAHDKIIEGLEKMIEEIEDMEFVFEDFIQQLLDGADGIAAALASAIAAINAAASGIGGGSGGGGSGAGGSYTPKTGVPVIAKGVPVIAKEGYTVMLKPNGEVRVAPDPILEDIKKMAHDKNREKVLGRYAAGGVADYTGHAHLDGSKSSPEVIFNSNDAAKLYHLVHTTPNLVDKLIGNVQAKFEAILPAGFNGSGNPSMTTDNSRKVYWNGNVLMEGQDADNFLTMLERVLPVV